MGEVIERFPLFPLGLVCLPTEIVPLHIFEERYRTMIGECLAADRPFGILWLSDAGLREIGCTVAVTEVLERMPDGRLNILCRGERPFRLLRRIEDLPYPAGDVELLDDAPGEQGQEAAALARERYADLVERASETRPDHHELDDLSAYAMAARIEFDLSEKQALLELRSEPGRLRLLAELIDTAVRRLEQAERTGELARSNGHVRRSGD